MCCDIVLCTCGKCVSAAVPDTLFASNNTANRFGREIHFAGVEFSPRSVGRPFWTPAFCIHSLTSCFALLHSASPTHPPPTPPTAAPVSPLLHNHFSDDQTHLPFLILRAKKPNTKNFLCGSVWWLFEVASNPRTKTLKQIPSTAHLSLQGKLACGRLEMECAASRHEWDVAEVELKAQVDYDA